MHRQLIEKPLIIAICGKSCSGKTSLANWLTDYFSSLGLFTHNIVSATTRPKREGEISGTDYYFIKDEQFNKLVKEHKFIEHTHFRGWQYGVPYAEIKSGYINIGVFNVEGLKTLRRSKYDYTIIPIYLEEKFWTRMRRAHDRENKWKIEYFRRALADWKDFRHVERELRVFHGRYLKMEEVNGVWRQANYIVQRFVKWQIFIPEEEGKKMRLGNFV